MGDASFQRQLGQLCRERRFRLDALEAESAAFIDYLSQLEIAHRVDAEAIWLVDDIDLIDAASIQKSCEAMSSAQEPGWHYRLVTGSTNVDALRYFDQFQQPVIAFAEAQTGGRGRRGNLWYSPFAKNIYCTVGLIKSIEPASLGLLSIVTGLALCDGLVESGIPGVQLKWPNDLYFKDQKLGGILIETRPMKAGQYFLAIGFGINVLMTTEALAGVGQAATSLQLISPHQVSRERVLQQTIIRVVDRIAGFDASMIPALVKAFNARDVLANRRVNVTTSGPNGESQTLQGFNQGIAPNGQLRVDTEQGPRLFSAAEISLRSSR